MNDNYYGLDKNEYEELLKKENCFTCNNNTNKLCDNKFCNCIIDGEHYPTNWCSKYK